MFTLKQSGPTLRACTNARKVAVGSSPRLYVSRQTPAYPGKAPQRACPQPVARTPAAALAECAPPAAEAPPAARPALYLLHCHLPDASGMGVAQQRAPEGGQQDGQRLMKLRDELKTMEKVAKKAAWFSTVEAEDGEHVLFVTDCAKHARKYGLQRLPDDAESYGLELPGRPVVVPLAEVAAALRAAGDPEDSGSEDEDVAGPMQAGVAVTAACAVEERAAKQARKEEKRAAKEAKKAAKAAAKMGMGGAADEDSEDDSDDEEDDKEKEKERAQKKAAKKEEEKKEKKKEKKEEKEKKKEKAVAAKDLEDSGSGSEDEEGGSKEEKVKDKEGKKEEKKKEKAMAGAVAGMEEEEDSESDEESSGESSDEDEEAMAKAGAMAPAAAGEAKPMAAMPADAGEESGSDEDESSSSSDSTSESESEEEMERKA